MFIATSHWSGSRPPAPATPSILILTRPPLGYPVVALCHGDAAAWICRTNPFMCSSSSEMGVDGEVGHLKGLHTSLFLCSSFLSGATNSSWT